MKNVFKFILFIVFTQRLLFSEEISLTLKNFNNEVRDTFIKPLFKKDFYITQLISFEKIHDYSFSDIRWINKERDLAERGYLYPFRLTFKLTIKQKYVEQFEDFIKKISRSVQKNPKIISKYSIVFSDNPFGNVYRLSKFFHNIEVFQLNKIDFLRFKSVIEDFYKEYTARLRIAFLDKDNFLVKEVYYESFSPKGYYRDGKESEISSSYITVVLPNGNIEKYTPFYDSHWFFADVDSDKITFYRRNPFLLSVVFYLGDEDLKHFKKVNIEVQWIRKK